MKQNKLKLVVLSALVVLAFAFCSLIFAARYLPFAAGYTAGRFSDADILSEYGLTRFTLGVSAMWLEKDDTLQLSYESEAASGALVVELHSLRVSGPAYKSAHHLPGKDRGVLSFKAPSSGVYQLNLHASRKKSPEAKADANYAITYRASWKITRPE